MSSVASVTDRLKLPWAVGAPLTSTSRRLFPFPRGLGGAWGSPSWCLVQAARLDGRTAVVPCARLRRRFLLAAPFAEVAMFAIAFIPVFVYVLLNLLVLARLADLQSLLRGRGPAGMSQSWPKPLEDRSGATQRAPAHPISHSWVGCNGRHFRVSRSMASGIDFLRLVWAQDFGTSDPNLSARHRLLPVRLAVPQPRSDQPRPAHLKRHVDAWACILSDGGLRFGAERYIAADPKVLRHLIANAVLLLTAWAWGYYLDRFGLLTRSAGAVLALGTRTFTSSWLACGSRWVRRSP